MLRLEENGARRYRDSPIVLFFCTLPVLSLLGTVIMNRSGNNAILMVLILAISFIPILITVSKSVSEKVYPLAIYSSALSLLLHRSLISSYLWGWDIQFEYHYANNVLQNHIWNLSIQNDTNSMLSIVMLAPELSMVSDVNLVWIFKAIYPILFALVPVCIYKVLRIQVAERIAFLSAFFFISFFVFYAEMPQLCKQQIGEFSLILIVLVSLSRVSMVRKSVLMIVFGFLLVVSHYAIAYILLFSLPVALYFSLRKPRVADGQLSDSSRISMTHGRRWGLTPNHEGGKNSRITPAFALFFVLATLSWYMFVPSASAFNSVLNIGGKVISNLFPGFANPETSQGLNLLIENTASVSHELTKYLHVMTQLFILVGLAATLRMKKNYFRDEYIGFSIFALILLIFAVLAPYLASAFNTSRLYHVALIFLAPFAIIGGVVSIDVFSRFVRVKWLRRQNIQLSLLAIFLSVFLLFNSGFVYQVINDNPTSISLDANIDGPGYNSREVTAANWISVASAEGPIYSDSNRYELLSSLGAPFAYMPGNLSDMRGDSIVFLGTYNIVHQEVIVQHNEKALLISDYVNISLITKSDNKVFDNGGSWIYYKN